MKGDRVFIVKMKWDELSHYSRVKRVFFSEENATNFINKNKDKDRFHGAFWIISDREITDYEPPITKFDIELSNIEAIQEFVERMIAESLDPKWDCNIYLEEQWALCEKRRIGLND